MSLHKNEVIDPTFKGNLARFINHSCEPNCETQKWNVLGEVCVGIFTIKDVMDDEELTFNYGFDVLKTTFQRCLCKSTNCRGFLGIVQSINGKVQSKINCDQCKNSVRSTEPLLVCESCNKIVHKKCALNMKKAIITDSMFKCQKCVKGKTKKSVKTLPQIKEKQDDDINHMNTVNTNDMNMEDLHIDLSEKETNLNELNEAKFKDLKVKKEPKKKVKDFTEDDDQVQAQDLKQEVREVREERPGRKVFEDNAVKKDREDRNLEDHANKVIRDDKNDRVDREDIEDPTKKEDEDVEEKSDYDDDEEEEDDNQMQVDGDEMKDQASNFENTNDEKSIDSI